jgi:hypothetical protein
VGETASYFPGLKQAVLDKMVAQDGVVGEIAPFAAILEALP